MARKKPAGDAAFMLFNAIYEDGAQTSNRKVPTDAVDIADEAAVRAFLEADDRRIAALSGRPRGPIKKLVRAGK